MQYFPLGVLCRNAGRTSVRRFGIMRSRCGACQFSFAQPHCQSGAIQRKSLVDMIMQRVEPSPHAPHDVQPRLAKHIYKCPAGCASSRPTIRRAARDLVGLHLHPVARAVLQNTDDFPEPHNRKAATLHARADTRSNPESAMAAAGFFARNAAAARGSGFVPVAPAIQ